MDTSSRSFLPPSLASRPALTVLMTLLLLASGSPFSRAQAPQMGVSDRDIQSLQTDAGGTDNTEEEQPDAFASLVRMLGALAAVLVLIALCAYLAKRFLPRTVLGSAARSDAIRIVATRMLGGRRSLVLVRVRGQTLLLGVTPQSIACLTEIHDMEGEWAQPPEQESSPKTSPFSRQLGRIVNETVDD
ncbi:flagellar biosynthetic protein FliO [Candidatus Sumerlaeota bacterium]|nr:flagellar biosynthetic protein FliO [Candidatus Sumerlaeota bacterium]